MNEKPFNLNQGEEGLDDLFRHAAEAEQPAAPAHAWLKMNQLLDEEEQKRRRGFAWWWLPLLLFMAGHRHFVPQAGEREGLNEKASARQQVLQQKFTAKESIAELKNTDHSTVATAEKSILNINSTTSSVIRAKKQSSESVLDIPFEPEITPKKSLSYEYTNEMEDNTLYPSLPQKQQLILPVSISLNDPAVPGQSITLTKKQSPSKYRFYVYGGGGADLGFINSKHAADVKPSYGAGFGLQLNNRWAIQAGFTQTRKIYEAPGDAYTPKAGSYYDNPNFVIKEVEADCAILEIPLSVRYGFITKNKHQVFGMLSIQNALMQRESYDYYYYRFGQPANGYYTYRTKALELFSGIGFSLGYEYRISDRLHIQAAPYFNLPTKGIGEGSVKLRSAGLFTGLRYSFWKKK
ncbi:MAG: hypothetical protein JNK20_06520 [Flavipsychrobacter sp.]|nr:hypothetical protein [Flavipsychrobacter sp.]